MKSSTNPFLCKKSTPSITGTFRIITDHAPLQWLSAQKMEGMLCRWALALQEYDFDIVHRKGSLNGNADALSRLPDPHCATTVSTPLFTSADLLSLKSYGLDGTPVLPLKQDIGINIRYDVIDSYGASCRSWMVFSVALTLLAHTQKKLVFQFYQRVSGQMQ